MHTSIFAIFGQNCMSFAVFWTSMKLSLTYSTMQLHINWLREET